MPLTQTSAVRQLSDGNPVGTVLGNALNSAGTPDLVGFYGGTPQAQTSGAAQAALVRGVQAGVMTVNATSQSPTSVGTNTSVGVSLTLGVSTAAVTGPAFQIASGDLLYVQKPTAQAGLGLGNVRVSATNIAGVTFSNFTGATVTPTAGEKYAVVALRGLTTFTPTLTPASVAAATTVEQLFTVTGIRAGELVQVMKPTTQAGIDLAGCRVAGPNQVGITYANMSATTAVTPTAESYTIFSLGGLDAVSDNIMIQQNVGTTTAGTGTNTTEQGFTCTGLLATDMVVGVSKPTAQAGLFIGGARVSGANSLGITIGNVNAAVTATSNEVYGVQIFRQNPGALCVNYSVQLTPAAVAPNTTAEQMFTVTGVIANSVAFANKPSFTTGIGIQGVRAGTSANQLAINFVNATANTITPPAETYLISNFQPVIPDAGSTWIFQVTPQMQQATILVNAIRNALAGCSFIAGA